MVAILMALLIGAGFTLSSLLALGGSVLTARGRSYAVAVAAALLLALSFGDLFPHGLELAGRPAVAGFIGAFALLFLIESATHAHTHHAPSEHVHRHAYAPFVWGLAFHNLMDGFTVGISAAVSTRATAVIGVGVLVHQIPVGLSLAAVLAAAHTPRRTVIRLAVLLGVVIPLATGVTLALPPLSPTLLGILVSTAGGVLAYISTAHLLPEAQAEHPSRTTGVVFAATLLLMLVGLFTVLGD